MRIPSLFGRGRGDSPSPQPEFFDVGGTAYAVGDVHGKLNLLKALVDRIRADVANPATPGPKTLVFMGDYVDRGEDSRGVLEYLAALDIPDCELVFLRGNHEQQMVDFIDEPLAKRRWLDWGGRETLASFGFPAIFPTADDEEYIRMADAFGEALGALRRFIDERTVLWWRIGNVVFSHGGMEPSLPIDQQSPKTMLWGSDAFMKQGGPPGYWHVHGHVIQPKPGIFGNRIAVDTGAYDTGLLTVARITDDGCAFLQQS
jgi:serine/threonine protein phosphatase 1